MCAAAFKSLPFRTSFLRFSWKLAKSGQFCHNKKEFWINIIQIYVGVVLKICVFQGQIWPQSPQFQISGFHGNLFSF